MAKQYTNGNGKNPNRQPSVGDPDLIQAGPRDTKTAAKYDVGSETIAAGDLQKQPKRK